MGVFELLGGSLMVAGVLLSLIAAWGLLDFPSALARMHAATKSASLGLALVAIGAGVAAGSAPLTALGVLVSFFMFLTAPISGHMLGRASYRAGQVTNLVHDDLVGAAVPAAAQSRAGRQGLSGWRMVPLVVIWVVLWRDTGPGVWIGGALVALTIELIRRTGRPRGSLRLGAFLTFMARYAWMLIVSNARVALEVITPRNDQIREAIVAVPLRSDSIRVALLVANAISYTPGSLTIELAEDPLTVYVHVLHFESVEEVRRDVGRLEDLVGRALNEPIRV